MTTTDSTRPPKRSPRLPTEQTLAPQRRVRRTAIPLKQSGSPRQPQVPSPRKPRQASDSTEVQRCSPLECPLTRLIVEALQPCGNPSTRPGRRPSLVGHVACVDHANGKHTHRAGLSPMHDINATELLDTLLRSTASSKAHASPSSP